MSYRHAIDHVVRELNLRNLGNSYLCQRFWIDLGKIGTLADLWRLLVGSRPMRLRSGFVRWLQADAGPGCWVVNVYYQPTPLGRFIYRSHVPFKPRPAF